jgi:hypothetical protein
MNYVVLPVLEFHHLKMIAAFFMILYLPGGSETRQKIQKHILDPFIGLEPKMS